MDKINNILNEGTSLDKLHHAIEIVKVLSHISSETNEDISAAKFSDLIALAALRLQQVYAELEAEVEGANNE